MISEQNIKVYNFLIDKLEKVHHEQFENHRKIVDVINKKTDMETWNQQAKVCEDNVIEATKNVNSFINSYLKMQ